MKYQETITNPWKDIAAYSVSDAYRFKGREEEIEKFLKIVRRGTVSVLYANSGIGKTSFINAGIIPTLFEEGYYPIHILFPTETLQNEQIESWLYQKISDGLNNPNLPVSGDYCWEKTINIEHEVWNHSLWWLLNTYRIINKSTKTHYKPLIIFDQFEEVFTKSNKNQKTNVLENLFNLIEKLCSTSFPRDIEHVLDQLYEAGNRVELSNLREYKVIFSLRKEYLSDFDYWTNDRNRMAELHQNRMFLLPLSRVQAKRVITTQPVSKDNPKLVTVLNAITEPIVNLIDTKGKNEVEPFILSILCSNLFKKAQAENKQELTERDIEFNADTLILNFYEENINKIITNKSHLERFEECLVDNDGLRNRVKVKVLSSIPFEQLYQEPLEKLHLIRIDSYNEENYVELIHDRIADAINERRRIAKLKKQDKNWNWFWVLAIAILAIWAIKIFMVSPSRPHNSEDEITEYLDLALYSGDTLAFKEKGHLENNHMVEQLFISDTTSIRVNNCSYLKELNVELPEGEQKLSININNCQQIRMVNIPDTVKELIYHINNCPGLKLPIPRGVEVLSIYTYDSDCTYGFAVNNNNFAWEIAVPYNEEGGKANTRSTAIKDSTQHLVFTLWDKRDGKLLYAQRNVPEVIYFPKYSNYTHSNAYIGGRNIKNANYQHVVKKEKKSSIDTINVRNVSPEDVTNSEAEFIYLTDSVRFISPSAFKKCKRLKRIRLSPNIYTIYENAFQGCEQLDSITLPDSLTYICQYAFEGCKNLHHITFANVNSLYLHKGVFAKCANLQSIEITGNINSYFREWGGDPYFFNPFFECKKLYDITLRNPKKSNLFIKDYIAYAKNDSMPIFTAGEENHYPSVQSLSEYLENIDGVCFTNILEDKKENYHCYIVNQIIPKELFFPKAVGRATVHFLYTPDSLRAIHIPFAQPFNLKYSLTFDIPDSLAQNIEIIVPYGCSKYYVNNPFYTGFKAVKEESLATSQWNIIKLFFRQSSNFFTNQWWATPAFVAGCLLFGCIVYFFRRRYLLKRNREIDGKKLAVFLTKLILLAILLYTIIFWLLVGYMPQSPISNNVIAILSAIMIALIITIGKSGTIAYISKLALLLRKGKKELKNRNEKIGHILHSNSGKQKIGTFVRNALIAISALATGIILVLVIVEINDIPTMMERKDYQRALDLIYKKVVNSDSVNTSVREQMQKMLIQARAMPGLPDSVSISGEIVDVDEDNRVVYITKGDSLITFDIKNKKKYVTEKGYKLSKRGKVFSKRENNILSFIPTDDTSKKYTTNISTRNWSYLNSERFVAVSTDTILYLYDLEKEFACTTFPVQAGYTTWGQSKDDKYFAIREPISNITKIYILPEMKKLIFDKPYIVMGFVNNQVIISEPNWVSGKTHLANINENFDITATYQGYFSCLSNDQKSYLFTVDNKNVYWWSLFDYDDFNGKISKSALGVEENTSFSSERFAILRSANRKVLSALNDYGIPTGLGRYVGTTNDCFVFSDDNAHITRIVDPQKPQRQPVTIYSAWPLMINADSKQYLLVCDNEQRWNSDSTSVYNGREKIVTYRYNSLHLSSEYAITGWYEPKTFHPLTNKSQEPRVFELKGYSAGQISVMDGWIFAAYGTNLRVFNFLTLEELINQCEYFTDEQKKKLTDSINK